MSFHSKKLKVRKGPHYHRIPEVRERRRKVVTAILILLIIAWGGVSFWLMKMGDFNKSKDKSTSTQPKGALESPLELIKP